MPCRLRLISFGWSPHFVYRHLVGMPLGRGGLDEVVALITSKPVDQYSEERFKEAFDAVRKFLYSIGYTKDPELIVLELSKEPLEVFRKLAEYVASKNCEEVTIDVSGGLRVHNVVLTLLAMYLAEIIKVRFFVGLEISSRLYEVPLKSFKALNRVGPLYYEVLYLASKCEMSAQELEKHVRRDLSYIRKVLKQLVEWGFVMKVRRGKSYTFKTTELGFVALNILKLRLNAPPQQAL